MKKKKIRKRNVFAFALESAIFRQRIKESKKKYKREREKEKIKKAMKEIDSSPF